MSTVHEHQRSVSHPKRHVIVSQLAENASYENEKFLWPRHITVYCCSPHSTTLGNFLWPVSNKHNYSSLSYVGKPRKMSFRTGTEKNQVLTWIFDLGMKFNPGTENRDEQISPRDHVNTKRQMARHRGETHPGMSSLM